MLLNHWAFVDLSCHCNIWVKVNLWKKSKNSAFQRMIKPRKGPFDADIRIGNLHSNVFNSVSSCHVANSNFVCFPLKSSASCWVYKVQREEYSNYHIDNKENKAEQAYWRKPYLIIMLIQVYESIYTKN